MIFHTIVSLFGLLCLVSLVVLFLVYDYKEQRLKAKARLLRDLIEKGYETDEIDLNNYLNI